MSTVTGTVVEVGDFKKRSGARIKTAFGTVFVGQQQECAMAFAGHLYANVVVEVSDTDGRVLSVNAVTP